MTMDERLIDANEAICKMRNEIAIPVFGKLDNSLTQAIRMINIVERASTIDAVRVVRCHECKHAASTRGASVVHCYTCDNECSPCRCRFVEPTFGCLYGEKKDGAE